MKKSALFFFSLMALLCGGWFLSNASSTSIPMGYGILPLQNVDLALVLPYLPETQRWKYIVIHHSATERGNAQIFDKGHHLRGFPDGLGYDFVVNNGTYGKRMGQIETGHRWFRQMMGAHCSRMNMNENGIGICLVGNFSEKEVPGEQLASAVWLVKQLQKRYGIPNENVIQHREAKNTTECPGKLFPWEDFRQMLQNQEGDAG